MASNNTYNKKKNYSNNRNYNRNNNYNRKKNYKKREDDKEIDKSTEIVEEEVIKKEKGDTTSLSVINTKELNDLIDEDLGLVEEKEKEKVNRHIFVHMCLIILLITGLIFFLISVLDTSSSIISLISNLLITLFTILFVGISITYNKKSKLSIFICSLLLFGFFIIGINNNIDFLGNNNYSKVEDFTGKSLTEVIKWAKKNNIQVNQEYEYSDMVKEYEIISQDVDQGVELNKVKEITVSVSEGPNPSKEIIIPSMIGWDDERVIKYVKSNYLSNVEVQFVESEKMENTVIEQNASGSLKRDDNLVLTFSYGEELGFSEVTLKDFTNMSKFEVEFYMKQNQLNYHFNEDFSSKIKRGYAASQDIKAGEVVSVNGDIVTVTISKGPKIKVPDFTNMSMESITEWAIKKKVKLSFSDKYSDKVKENNVIEADKTAGDIIEEGSVVKVVISRGALKMPKFKSLSQFYSWADKYEIKYEEVHEFSDTVEAGDVISYSYKTGDKIRLDEAIVVTISDGVKSEVPNLVGLSKSEATTKLEKANLKYNFIYKNSSKKKNTVISQSISAGSEISSNTTISVTLSNGKGDDEEDDSYTQRRTSNNTSNNNSNTNTTPSTPSNTCNSCTITGLKGVIRDNMDSGYQATANALASSIKSQCPGITVNISGDSTSGKAAGSFLSGFNGGSTNSCDTVSIVLAR